MYPKNGCEKKSFIFSLSHGREKINFDLSSLKSGLEEINFYFLSPKNGSENKRFLFALSQLINRTELSVGSTVLHSNL